MRMSLVFQVFSHKLKFWPDDGASESYYSLSWGEHSWESIQQLLRHFTTNVNLTVVTELCCQEASIDKSHICPYSHTITVLDIRSWWYCNMSYSMIPTQWLLDVITSVWKEFLQGRRECCSSYIGSERGIVSQTVTVEAQITEGRVAHTGSAFLLLTVTAPTDVCLNCALIHGEITSPLKSPPTPPSPPML